MKPSNYGILSTTSLLSFELSNECNLKGIHPKCAINCRKYKSSNGKHLTAKVVVEMIKIAKDNGFTGMVAFHYYNEPLLNKDEIMEIIDSLPNCKYLLWTNGTLLDKDVGSNSFLSRFTKVCLTCYSPERMKFYQDIKEYYKNVEIFDWELDDRLDIYDKEEHLVELSCKRPLFELPIDYFGNIHLCCMDWNNEYRIGNIFESDFSGIIQGDNYRSLISMCKKRRVNEKILPPICKKCDKLWVYYPHYYNE